MSNQYLKNFCMNNLCNLDLSCLPCFKTRASSWPAFSGSERCTVREKACPRRTIKRFLSISSVRCARLFSWLLRSTPAIKPLNEKQKQDVKESNTAMCLASGMTVLVTSLCGGPVPQTAVVGLFVYEMWIGHITL